MCVPLAHARTQSTRARYASFNSAHHTRQGAVWPHINSRQPSAREMPGSACAAAGRAMPTVLQTSSSAASDIANVVEGI